MLPRRLAGKTVWLIGASSGMGRELAKLLGATDCNLVLSARREEELANAAKESNDAHYYTLDVTNPKRVCEVAEIIERDIGPIDIVIANAGTHTPTEVEDFKVETYRKIMEVNFFGVLHAVSSVLPKMIERKSGYIVAVSSVAGYRGLPRSAAYGASKSALTHFTESLRLDVEPYNIDVSVISPGFVKTPLTDQNDFEMPFLMEPEDAAKEMFEGIIAQKKEIHFPWKFTYILKFLSMLPLSMYHRIIFKTVKKND